VLVLAGCPKPVVVPQTPIDFGPQGRLTDPSVALEAVVARRAKMRSIQGEAKATVETPQGGGKVTELVAAELPARLRLDAVTMLGPAASLASDGERYQFADHEHKRFYDGPAVADSIARLLPVRIPPAELVSLLLGQPPLLEGAQPLSLEVDDAHGVYLLTLGHLGDREVLGLDPATLRPVKVLMEDRPGLSAYRAELREYEGEADLPKIVRVSTADGTGSIELKWRERDVNPVLEPGMFTLKMPDGFTRDP
jgi:hypothetical protein